MIKANGEAPAAGSGGRRRIPSPSSYGCLVMKRLIVAVVLVWCGGAAYGQYGRAVLLNEQTAARFGLTRAWHAQIALDPARGRVRTMSQYVSSTRTQTVYHVVSPLGNYSFLETTLNQFGHPIGPMGAVEQAARKIVEICEQLQTQPPAGVPIDKDAVDAAHQAAQQVLQNIEDFRQEQYKAEKPQEPDIDKLATPLFRRAAAAPDALPKLEQLVVPEVTLFVSTDLGVIHVLDGLTGRTQWTMQLGEPGHPNMTPVANENVVAVVSGVRLYILDRATGRIMWEKKLEQVPGASPVLNDDFVFVPTLSGRLEAYRLFRIEDDPIRRTRYVPGTGRAMVQPVATPFSVAWATDRGFFYVADGIQLSVRYRLETGRDITVAPAYVPSKNLLLVGSIDGYLYCIQEYSGEIFWRFSAGEPIVQKPVVVDDVVYIVTDTGGMFQISLENGADQWWTTGVRKFLAASEQRVYCEDRSGNIAILDRKSGGLVGNIPAMHLDFKFTNMQTDRLFVGTTRGTLMCLHEAQRDWPLFHWQIEPQQRKAQGKEVAAAGEAPTAPAEPPATTNPFGGAADPFGGSKPAADPFGGDKPAADPFGGGAPATDPFGGGKPAGDPFGGTTDPFGGATDPFGGTKP